jgi:hypothetical protein
VSNSATNGGLLAATPATVGGFMISDWVGFSVLLIVAGVGLVVLGRSMWSRRVNDRHLGVR